MSFFFRLLFLLWRFIILGKTYIVHDLSFSFGTSHFRTGFFSQQMQYFDAYIRLMHKSASLAYLSWDQLGLLQRKPKMLSELMTHVRTSIAAPSNSVPKFDPLLMKNIRDKYIRQYMYNVTLSRLCVTTVAWESSKYYILWVCVCSLRYRACEAQAP